MARDRIFVVTFGSSWKVRCEHCGEEIFSTQSEALKRARKHVAEYPKGTLSQILIQGSNSQFRTEWTYGNDPYPPRG
jgi:hypothetical protein